MAESGSHLEQADMIVRIVVEYWELHIRRQLVSHIAEEGSRPAEDTAVKEHRMTVVVEEQPHKIELLHKLVVAAGELHKVVEVGIRPGQEDMPAGGRRTAVVLDILLEEGIAAVEEHRSAVEEEDIADMEVVESLYCYQIKLFCTRRGTYVLVAGHRNLDIRLEVVGMPSWFSPAVSSGNNQLDGSIELESNDGCSKILELKSRARWREKGQCRLWLSFDNYVQG